MPHIRSLPDFRFMSFSALLLASQIVLGQTASDGVDEFDRQSVQKAVGSVEDAALLRYLKTRTLTAEDTEKVRQWVRELVDKDAKTRKDAKEALLARGASSLPFLKSPPKDLPEVSMRAAEVIRQIETSRDSNVAASVLRILATRSTTKEFAATIFAYLPFVQEEHVEEAAFRVLGKHVRSGDGIIPEVAAALKSSEPKIRAAAAYVSGRYGSLADREAARKAMTDDSEVVRKRAAESLAGRRAVAVLADSAAADATLLKAQNVGVVAKDVLDWIRARTLSPEGLARLKAIAANLGSGDFKARTKATRDLIKEGNAAIPFVQPFLDDGNAEVRRRANQIIDEIRQGPGPALPAAALRQAARVGKSPEALRVLLAYLPFVDDAQNIEEAHNSLTLLAGPDAGADAILADALKDELPARRAAASLVLGRIGNKDQVQAVRVNLDDANPLVRIRAAQGLMAAHDNAGLDSLIGLLPRAPASISWQIEEELHRLAGEKAPVESLGEPDSEQRKKASLAWEKWGQANGKRIDLRTIGDQGLLGLFVVCEHDTRGGLGRVSEFGRDGRVRWSIEGLSGPMDAQVLPNGNILVAENSANRVVEYDLQKRVVWEHRLPANPISCQRLANGNTFIGCYNTVLEVAPDKKVVYQHNPGPGFYCFSATKLPDGTILCLTAQGMVQEVDSSNGNIKKSVRMPQPGGWGSAQMLPNRKYLVATMTSNQVQEIDDSGTVLWKANVPGVFRAMRLPNGNTMAVSMTNNLVAELDREGRTVWEKRMEGRPWSVRYR